MTKSTHRPLPTQGGLLIVALIFSALFAVVPVGVLAAPGDLYVTNLASNTIDVYSPAGEKSTFASGLNSPQGLVFDQAHNLYVADAGSGSIFRYDTAGNQTTFFSGLSAPGGLAIDGNKLLVTESRHNIVITLALDHPTRPQVFLFRDDPVLGLAVGGDARYITYGVVMESETHHSIAGYLFFANTQGVTAVRRGGVERVYVTTDNGDIWVIDPSTMSRRLFASGLSDPNGMASLPGSLGGDDGGGLYVADRAAGEIFKYAADGTQSVFASDAGIPNFLVFESE